MRFLLRKPSVLEALAAVLSTCVFHVRLSLMLTPKHLALTTAPRTCSYSAYTGFLWFFFSVCTCLNGLAFLATPSFGHTRSPDLAYSQLRANCEQQALFCAQQTHNVATTLLQRHCNITMLQRRCCDVVCLLGACNICRRVHCRTIHSRQYSYIIFLAA